MQRPRSRVSARRTMDSAPTASGSMPRAPRRCSGSRFWHRGGPRRRSAQPRERGARRRRPAGGDHHVGVHEPSDAAAQLHFRDRRDLVDHQARGRPQAVRLVRFDSEAEQRSVGWIAREGADGDGLGGVEAIILHDHQRTRLARVVSASGSSPDLSALHSSRLIWRRMKAWSLAAYRLDATRRDCREASAASSADRVSGTHIWIGRKPCARRRSR